MEDDEWKRVYKKIVWLKIPICISNLVSLFVFLFKIRTYPVCFPIYQLIFIVIAHEHSSHPLIALLLLFFDAVKLQGSPSLVLRIVPVQTES